MNINERTLHAARQTWGKGGPDTKTLCGLDNPKNTLMVDESAFPADNHPKKCKECEAAQAA